MERGIARKRPQKSLFAEFDEIIARLRSDERQDLVILIVPSHDRKEVELKNQEFWAQSALDLFGDLYGGATAFKTFAGVYKDEDGRLLHDKPILIESYVQRADLEDREKLLELLRFAKRMGREMNQAAVGLVVNQVFHSISDFNER